MNSGIGMRHDAHSPRAVSWVIAAILLVLHWAAPGAVQIHAVPTAGNASPGFSSATLLLQRGIPPRALPRIPGLEAGAAKTKETGWTAGGKHALLPDFLVGASLRTDASAAPIVRAVEPRPGPARAFDARAPPALTA